MTGHPIEERPLLEAYSKHLFKAKRLGAQLDLIRSVRLWATTLVLDRVRHILPIIPGSHLHHVRYTNQPQLLMS